MVGIGDTLVSEDVLREAFCCDLAACKGGCCNSEGDSGAPLDADELAVMDAMVEQVWDQLTPRAQQVLREQGPYFKDKAGDWVTSVVEGHDCVFCTYPSDEECLTAGVPSGSCLCAIEKAFREGQFTTHPAYRDGKEPFMKPVSCHLYPVRLKQLGDYLALNYDEQVKLCGCAIKKGRKLNVKVYQCVKDALVRRFGQKWYEELELCVSEMEKAGML
ncbi:MAG: DUF3109 family protein [Bacteroidales bacterium]|nr:DUF3109 family protein [Bacteroidales bacterium]MBP5214131.1 DUF3109 family protein [Bacteroidales bacterium]MBP5765327.1 DUF3109 family protein [Bacteroidales bacterium]